MSALVGFVYFIKNKIATKYLLATIDIVHQILLFQLQPLG